MLWAAYVTQLYSCYLTRALALLLACGTTFNCDLIGNRLCHIGGIPKFFGLGATIDEVMMPDARLHWYLLCAIRGGLCLVLDVLRIDQRLRSLRALACRRNLLLPAAVWLEVWSI